jgi:hypothetical protein
MAGPDYYAVSHHEAASNIFGQEFRRPKYSAAVAAISKTQEDDGSALPGVLIPPDPSVLFSGKDACLSPLQNLCSRILRGPQSLGLRACIFLDRPILKLF